MENALAGGFTCDVVIIGAGPAGANAAALLRQRGYSVIVLERGHFPRFSIGESLLPACMDLLDASGLLPAVQAAGFQIKKGATFRNESQYYSFDFSNAFTAGWATTYQVQRAHFDQVLADGAAAMGADFRYGCTVTGLDLAAGNCVVTYREETGAQGRIRARFCLDASGMGRVLARLLDLDRPSDFPVRKAVFAHFIDRISDPDFNREKITVAIHPHNPDVWYWIIPFADGTCSVGAVAEAGFYDGKGETEEALLRACIAEAPYVSRLLANASLKAPARQLTGYSSSIKCLHGDSFAILGNAGEFLDPIFSSGVTIALKSSALAVEVLDRQMRGEAVDWEADFAAPLMFGVETFRTYVEAWYKGDLQKVFFFPSPKPEIVRMLCSILAGYAWDTSNPYVKSPRRRLNALVELCSYPL